MLRIRLRRMGAKNMPAYRVVVADSRSPRDGRLVDIVGHYSPLTNPETVVINKEKASSWLSKGAQPSDTVRRLLTKVGVLEQGQVAQNEAKAGAEAPPTP
ncbi:MAG: 30S ribosomal protein S16 [Chloroflexota bacterium]